MSWNVNEPVRKRTRLAHTTAIKLEAIRRVYNGETKASVARAFRVPESTLRGWCKDEQLKNLIVKMKNEFLKHLYESSSNQYIPEQSSYFAHFPPACRNNLIPGSTLSSTTTNSNAEAELRIRSIEEIASGHVAEPPLRIDNIPQQPAFERRSDSLQSAKRNILGERVAPDNLSINNNESNERNLPGFNHALNDGAKFIKWIREHGAPITTFREVSRIETIFQSVVASLKDKTSDIDKENSNG